MNFNNTDIKEIIKQDKLVHTNAISKREHGLKKWYKSRDPYQRDYARILYSSAFRRLQGKMQILGIETSAFFRNRLTHSLEVAQIAKGIRCRLDEICYKRKTKLSDIFLLDAAALAHDIGHPAFGHKGERVLNKLLLKYGITFEGNAQNYRVLRSLEKKDPQFTGLNLTYRTLLAINKYIVKETFNVDKFMYAEDYEMLEDFRLKNNLFKIKTLDAQIIELADDIAYAVHDLEDALSQGYFNIDEILYEISIKDKSWENFGNGEYKFAVKEMNKLVMEAKKRAKKSSSYKNLQEYSQVFRKSLTSILTNYFIEDIVLGTVTDKEAAVYGTKKGNRELKLGKSRALCKILSKKIFKGVTRNPSIVLYEERGAIVIERLFNLYMDIKLNKGGKLLPPDYRPRIGKNDNEIIKNKKYARAASDYIAGMMDTYAIETYENLFAEKFSTICVRQ